MNDGELEVTGFFPHDNTSAAFYMNNYRMTILDTKGWAHDSGFFLDNIDGFIYGYTHGGMQFAAFVENNQIRVNGTARINAAFYIVGCSFHKTRISSFTTIRFRGGTLNKLFDPSALNIHFNKGEDIPVKQIDDSMHFTFKTDEFECTLTIQSNITGKTGLEGNVLKNDEVILSLTFDTEQAFSSIKRHYFCAMNCLSIMTNRKSVGVDEIEIITDLKSEQYKHYFKVYVRNDYELTKKDRTRCMGFSDLGNSVSVLFQLLYSNRDNKRMLSLGFFPENDKTYGLVSNDIIRSLCAALECEASYVSIAESETNAIVELRKHVKSLIRKYRRSHKGHDAISEKTYSLISSSLENWSLSASDRIRFLYKLHEKAMQPFPLTDNEIAHFVKYRNGITHGADQYIDDEVAATTINLRALVYCCLLSRIGVSEDKIESMSSLKINR